MPYTTPETRAARRRSLKERGLCVDECGRHAVSGKVSCAICGEKNRDHANRIHAERKSKGLCIRCGKRSAVRNKSKCGDCIETVHDLRAGSGLCTKGCGKPRAPHKKTCIGCLDKQREQKDRLKEKKLCITHCGQFAESNRFKCRACTIKATYKQSFYYAKAKGYAPFSCTLEEFTVWYEQHLEQSNGRCEYCDETYGDRFCIDHDHVTGKLRGLVCTMCNVVEGAGIDRVRKVLAVMEGWVERSIT